MVDLRPRPLVVRLIRWFLVVDSLRQDSGFDLQVIGWGEMVAYHAVNEYALLSGYVKGFQVIAHMVSAINANVSELKKSKKEKKGKKDKVKDDKREKIKEEKKDDK